MANQGLAKRKTEGCCKLVNNNGCSTDAAVLVGFIRTGHFSAQRREKNNTESFSVLLIGFGKSLAGHHGASLQMRIKGFTLYQQAALQH